MKIGFWINYCWRVIATGFCFALFALGALILGYFIVPVITVLTRDGVTRGLRVQHAIHITFKFFVVTMQLVGLGKFEFIDFDKLQNDKGCLIISNHPTLIDYVVIVSKLKHCEIIVKQALFDNFFVGKVVRAANYIPNEQSLATFEKIKNLVQQGNNLLIFPEGTRSVPNQPLVLQRGAANVSVRGNIPVRLLTIHTGESTLTKGRQWYKVAKHKVIFKVRANDCIKPQEFLTRAGSPSLAARHLTKYFKDKFEKDLTDE